MPEKKPTLCTTPTTLYSIVDELQPLSHIIIDLEGHELGSTNGSLGLISLGNPISKEIYLIDTVTLTQNNDSTSLKPLFTLLESTTPLKLMYDARMDWSELFHGFECDMDGIVDLQIADVLSRKVRGQGEREREARLYKYFYYGNVRGQPALYKSVQRLNGLKYCLKEHGVRVDEDDDDIGK